MSAALRLLVGSASRHMLAAASRVAMAPNAAVIRSPHRALSSMAMHHRPMAAFNLSRSYTAEKPKELFLAFTCTKCGSRTSGFMSKLAYERGVVIMRCTGCQAHHLVADHLGWIKEFQGKGVTVEDLMRAQGQSVTRIDLGNVLNFVGDDAQPAAAAQQPAAENAAVLSAPSKD